MLTSSTSGDAILYARLKSQVKAYLKCYNFTGGIAQKFCLDGDLSAIRFFLADRESQDNAWITCYRLLTSTYGWHGCLADANIRANLRQHLHDLYSILNDRDAAFILSQGYHNPLLQVIGDYNQDRTYDELKTTDFYPVRQDHLQLSFKYIIFAANENDLVNGNSDAQWILSQWYKNGNAAAGLSQDMQKSHKLLIAAARENDLVNGNSDAQWILSQMYKNGNAAAGLSQDMQKSDKLLIAAAREDDLVNGNSDAQWILSQWYKNGNAAAGVSQDMQKYYKLLIAAARENDLVNGNSNAQWIMNNMLIRPDNPMGLAVDRKRARKFLEAAAKKGHQKATAIVNRNSPPNGSRLPGGPFANVGGNVR